MFQNGYPYLNDFWEKYLKQQEILTVEVFLIKNVGTQYTFSLHLYLGLVLFYFTFELVIILDPSVADPDPDPHVFGPSGSISQRYGSGSF